MLLSFAISARNVAITKKCLKVLFRVVGGNLYQSLCLLHWLVTGVHSNLLAALSVSDLDSVVCSKQSRMQGVALGQCTIVAV